MVKVATREILALDVPRPPLPMRAIDVLGAWEKKLMEDEFQVDILPFIPDASKSYPERIMHNTDKSREILSGVGGLVVADSDMMILELDRSVLTHMEQASELGIPVFLQAPYEEVAPKDVERPACEVVYMGGQTSIIKNRLGE